MQGCGISPTVWNAFYQVMINYFDHLMEQAIRVAYGFDFKAGGKQLDKMLFADDLVNMCAPVCFWVSERTDQGAALLEMGWRPARRREGGWMFLALGAADVFYRWCHLSC